MLWITLPALRKQTRDNLGLIVSVLAALAAGWSVYEAHAARESADASARKTITMQLEATQLDERPYVNAVPVNPMFLGDKSLSDRFYSFTFLAKLRIITSGRTPALGVRLTFACSEFVDPISSDAYKTTIKRLTDNQQAPVPFAYLTTTGELQSNRCFTLISQSSYPRVVILGLLEYSDYFKTQHHTSFCYVGAFNTSNIRVEVHKDRVVEPFPATLEPMKQFEFVPCHSYQATFD